MIPKMNKDNLEVVAGAIRATIRKCNLERNERTINGVWSEVYSHETYSPADRLWVQLIRGWERNSDTAEKAYTRVRNLILKRWKEQDEFDEAFGTHN